MNVAVMVVVVVVRTDDAGARLSTASAPEVFVDYRQGRAVCLCAHVYTFGPFNHIHARALLVRSPIFMHVHFWSVHPFT